MNSTITFHSQLSLVVLILMFHFVSCIYSDCIFILYFNTFSDNDVLFILFLSKTEKLLIIQVAVFISVHSNCLQVCFVPPMTQLLGVHSNAIPVLS